MATKKQAAKQPASRNTRTTRSLRAQAQVEGPQYLVLSDSYIDQRLLQAGDTVVYYGLPGRALRPINAEAKARKKQVLDISKDRKLSPEDRQQRLTDLSNEWNGVVAEDTADDEFEGFEAQLAAAEAEREADRAEADEQARKTESGEVNQGADGGPGARAAKANYS